MCVRRRRAVRLSPTKFVFGLPSFSRLIVAELGWDLRLLNTGEFIDDALCWFCEYGISSSLFPRGDLPSCLLEKLRAG